MRCIQHKRSEPDATRETTGSRARAAIAAVLAAGFLACGPALAAAPAGTPGRPLAGVASLSAAAAGAQMRNEDWVEDFQRALSVLCIVMDCNDAAASPESEAALCSAVDTRCDTYETRGLRDGIGPDEAGAALAAVGRLMDLTKSDPDVLGGARQERFMSVLCGMEAELIQVQ